MAAEKPEYIINWHTHEKPLKEEEHKLKSEKTEIFLPRDSFKKKGRRKKKFLDSWDRENVFLSFMGSQALNRWSSVGKIITQPKIRTREALYLN